jgi:hypothetical protein
LVQPRSAGTLLRQVFDETNRERRPTRPVWWLAPRWSQEDSYWLETGDRFKTPLFNGYADEVGALYPDEPREPVSPLRPGETAR